MGDCLNIALLGAGIISRTHAKYINKRDKLNLVAVADIVKDKAVKLAEEYQANFYLDYKEMLRNENIDIAIVTLPHFLHKEASIDCAENKCHILLEKPMAMNKEECDEIIKVCELNNVKLQIGHIQTYHEVNCRAREIVESGELGDLLMISNQRYVDYFLDKRPGWFLKKETAGGGIVMNLGAHSLEIVKFFANSKFSSVKANLDYAAREEVEGNAMIHVTMENGVDASIILSGYKSLITHKTLLFLSRGMIEVSYWPEKITIKKDDGEVEEINCNGKHPLDLQIGRFVDCINNDLPVELSGQYGRDIIEAIDAVYESDESKKEISI